MSLFKNLFGKKQESPSLTPQEAEARRQFDEAWEKAVVRFGITTGMPSFRFDLVHPQTKQPMLPHEGIAGTFAEWRQIQSPWDRRTVLTELILQGVGGSLKEWQTANLMTAERCPDRALATLEKAGAPETGSDDYAPYCAACARALMGMVRCDEALHWARKAADAAPDDADIRVVLADALALSGDCDEANRIYGERVESTGPQTAATASVAEMFAQLFARETGTVHSPVFALQIAKSMADPAQAEEFWNLAEAEFYHSPYFRMQHAYHLADSGKMDRSLAKLIALVQEMPWLREASLNLVRLFEHFDPSGKKIMPEFQEHLRHTIQANGWTTEGMKKMEIGRGVPE